MTYVVSIFLFIIFVIFLKSFCGDSQHNSILYLKCYFVCFSQLDTPLTRGVFVFTMKWGHAHADLSLFV